MRVAAAAAAAPAFPEQEVMMGLGDKIHNAAEKLHGRSKEGAGRATGDERLRSEGRARHIRADLKQAGEKIKDAFRRH
jgi:uncharacterized protein YjbJ (UPF0337 family)